MKDNWEGLRLTPHRWPSQILARLGRPRRGVPTVSRPLGTHLPCPGRTGMDRPIHAGPKQTRAETPTARANPVAARSKDGEEADPARRTRRDTDPAR